MILSREIIDYIGRDSESLPFKIDIVVYLTWDD